MASATTYPEQQEVSEPHISTAIATENNAASALLPSELRGRSEADRRLGGRRPARIEALLYPMGGSAPLRCQCRDIGAGGMHVTAPIGYGLAVGQRYELLAVNDDPSSACAAGNAPSAHCELADAGRYVTVIRTEMHVDGENDSIGAALRFDHPLAI